MSEKEDNLSREKLLEKQVEELTALLEEALARDTKKVGVVKAGPDENGLYRVRMGDSDIIIKYQDGNVRQIPHDSEVIINSNLITDVISEELKPEIEDIEFKGKLIDEEFDKIIHCFSNSILLPRKFRKDQFKL